MQFQLGDARLFFARPSLQQIMFDLWRGVRPHKSDRGLRRRLEVSMQLIFWSFPNMFMVLLWALVPSMENWTEDLIIQLSDEARQEEEKTAKQEKEEPTRYQVSERCRARVFKVQSRVPLLFPRHKKYLAIVTNFMFAYFLIQEAPDQSNVAWLFQTKNIQKPSVSVKPLWFSTCRC